MSFYMPHLRFLIAQNDHKEVATKLRTYSQTCRGRLPPLYSEHGHKIEVVLKEEVPFVINYKMFSK